jgi:phosphate transport system permease protein
MNAAPLAEGPNEPAIVRPARHGTASWPLIDRVGYWLCWATGIGLCLIAIAIVGYFLVKGISYLSLSMFVTSPAPSLNQTQSGGFADPIIGTLVVTAIGTAIAAPLGVGLAAWMSEYARPRWLARTLESAIEMIAGAPSVVLAIFGLLIFSQGFLGFLSQHAATGGVLGQSFLNAGIVMSAIALPLVVGSTYESLAQLPDSLREGSYALGKTRATTIRHVLLPSVRPGIASGIVLGMGRIIGDTAIITILLGATLRTEAVGGVPVIGTLRGTGSTLTSYIYNNSPAGEGNSHEKAYAAAFVLLVMVLALNALVTRLTEGGRLRSREGLGRLRAMLVRTIWRSRWTR